MMDWSKILEMFRSPVGVEIKRQTVIEKTQRHLIVELRSDRFAVCQPIITKKVKWMGARKEKWLVHRTENNVWDTRKL